VVLTPFDTLVRRPLDTNFLRARFLPIMCSSF